MKRLLLLLLLLPIMGGLACAENPTVTNCFKVNALIKMDEDHYWADWTNACPFIIDSVYVEVGFLDHSHKQLGEGVWPMYFVLPGVHRVTRFSVPVGVSAYETVRVSRITTDSAEALRKDKHEIDAAEHETLPPGTVPDSGIGRVITVR